VKKKVKVKEVSAREGEGEEVSQNTDSPRQFHLMECPCAFSFPAETSQRYLETSRYLRGHWLKVAIGFIA